MAYFPFFVELTGRTGLLVGGGRTALEKAGRLLDYGPQLTVVAPEVLPELAALPGVRAVRRPFQASDLKAELAFVVAATDCKDINRQVAALCRARRIPVNVVDTPEDGTFLFPSLVRRGRLSVGISTGGASPSAAIYLKREIGALLPDRLEEILDWLNEVREPVKGRIPDGTRRKAIFRRLFQESLGRKRPLTDGETRRIVEELEQEETG